MDDFAVDLDKVLDDFELSEGMCLNFCFHPSENQTNSKDKYMLE